MPATAATWMAVGIVSLEDCPALTWSFGWTSLDPSSAPRISDALFAMTSLAFMFVEVPEPVWKISRTKWSSRSPSMTSWAASMIASALSASMEPISLFTTAAEALSSPSAQMNVRPNRRFEIGKFSTALWVDAP